MKSEEKKLFEIVLDTHPNFLDYKTWREGPEPPDVILTDRQDRLIGIELTEWLDKEQTTPSIRAQDHEHAWLAALDSEHHPPPKHFTFAQVSFHRGMGFPRFDREKVTTFREEFYTLMSYIKDTWQQEMADSRQKMWNDFSNYPTLGRYIASIHFVAHSPHPPQPGSRWVLGHAKGGAYDPKRATAALIERIDDKRAKPNYANLKSDLGLTELVLLVHYGIRGLIHNSPYDGLDWKLEDVLGAACENLRANSGPFDRVFLYFALNDGPLYNLFP
jgi:hypothetical protein